MRRKISLLLVFLALVCSSVFAFQFEPLVQTFDVSGPNATKTFTITNDSDDIIAVVVSALVRTQDAQGNEVTNFEDQIIYTPNGSELKEWYALATYLQSMGTVDGRYAAPEGRKVEDLSWNPVNLLKGLNLIGWIALVVCLAVLALVILIVYRLVTRKSRRRGGKGSGYRPYRG